MFACVCVSVSVVRVNYTRLRYNSHTHMNIIYIHMYINMYLKDSENGYSYLIYALNIQRSFMFHDEHKILLWPILQKSTP